MAALTLAQNAATGPMRRRRNRGEPAVQSRLLRDIFGNPFRPTPAILGAWRTWNGSCVVRVAQAIYEERAFELTPVLHDALLDAGCDDDAILAHCQTSEGHVRGCWVVDLLLQSA